MIPCGKRQHSRSADGNIETSSLQHFNPVLIGAVAVVVKPIPGGVTAVGNPARILDA